MTQKHSIAVIAALPPPVNGNFVVTKTAVDSFRSAGPVLAYNLSTNLKFSHLIWRIIKSVRSLVSLLKLVQWRFQKPTSLYTVANSGLGLYQNILTIGLARLLGYRCVLHHHSYSYLNQDDWRMRIIDRLLGPTGTHVVLAPEMELRFREVYKTSSQFFILPNSFIINQISNGAVSQTWDGSQPFHMGHISNLTIAKGLHHVLNTFEALCQTRDVRLTLAGPLMGRQEKALVEDFLERYPNQIYYKGPIYDEDKTRFFESIDLLLFPTEYKVEAQPLVIFESFAFGRPVIAYARACIPSMIGTDGGYAIPMQENFVSHTQRIVESWLDQPALYQALCSTVRNKSELLSRQSQAQLNGLIECVSGTAAATQNLAADNE